MAVAPQINGWTLLYILAYYQIETGCCGSGLYNVECNKASRVTRVQHVLREACVKEGGSDGTV